MTNDTEPSVPLEDVSITYNSQDEEAHCTMQSHVKKDQSCSGDRRSEGKAWM